MKKLRKLLSGLGILGAVIAFSLSSSATPAVAALLTALLDPSALVAGLLISLAVVAVLGLIGAVDERTIGVIIF